MAILGASLLKLFGFLPNMLEIRFQHLTVLKNINNIHNNNNHLWNGYGHWGPCYLLIIQLMHIHNAQRINIPFEVMLFQKRSTQMSVNIATVRIALPT